MQTLVGKFAGSESQIEADHVFHVPVADGDEMVLEVNISHQPKNKMLVLYHGLGGCSESNYMLRLCRKAILKGIDVARVNHRGCGRHSAECRGIYHSGSVDDVLASLMRIKKEYPNHQVYTVGFSLSGTILLNTLAEHSEKMPDLVHSAISVSAPLDLEASSLAIAKKANIKYNLFYTYFLKQQAKIRKEKYGRDGYPEVNQVKSLREFDEVYTATVGGFKNRDHYYGQWSPNQRLNKIITPTTLLTAVDDPIIPKYSIENLDLGNHTNMIQTKSGGHLGFISKKNTTDLDGRWMDDFIFHELESDTTADSTD